MPVEELCETDESVESWIWSEEVPIRDVDRAGPVDVAGIVRGLGQLLAAMAATS